MAVKRSKKNRDKDEWYDVDEVRGSIEHHLGKPESVRGGESNYECPFCHDSHLHIHYAKRAVICHGCGAKYRNLLALLRDLGGGGGKFRPKGKKALEAVLKILESEDQSDFELEEMDLPPHFRRLFPSTRDPYARVMVRYLRSRAVTDEQFEEYSIGYCDDGRFDGMVVFPVYVNEKRLFFTTRRVLGGGKKTLNPKVGESKRFVLMGYDRCLDAEPDVVYIVEGPFDLFALEAAGFYGVAVMGSTITEEQAALLSKLDAELVVVFDPDAHDKARQWSRFLSLRTPNEVSRVMMNGDNDLGDYAEKGEKGLKKIRKILSKRHDVDLRDHVKGIFNGTVRI